PLGIEFMQTISFILIIAFLVQVVEIILKKAAPSLYQALGIYLPLITTNCAVLGIAILAVQKDYNLIESVVYASSIAAGFTLAMILMAGIREQLEMTGVPKGMKGFPISLVIAGLLSLAFMGFSGIVK
ncbi:MAG TPA: Rnf-Nqr domain containing protein, partial [Bacteroidales bacterium]|nr:Rnf-Nqr domain containing protein [Bacteroidales bacterium]